MRGPAPQNGRIRTLAGKKTKHPIAGRLSRLQFGGAENGLLVIALQNSSTISRHAVRAIQGA
jgi:hypothetical protein